jgi:dienelactone hydrolase
MQTTMRIAAAAALALAGVARAEVRTKVIAYTQGDTPLRGFVAWDDAANGKRPGVLVIHEAWGENEHARNQALRLANAGYIGFALDMYGNGKVATHLDDARELKDAGAEVTVIAYPNARHSFTVPDAGKLGMEAVQYDADADRRSWEATVKMFREAFKS